MRNNKNLLRPFDRAAALAGAPVCWSHLDEPLDFVGVSVEPDYALYREPSGAIHKVHHSSIRMAPITWVERCPVYPDTPVYVVGEVGTEYRINKQLQNSNVELLVMVSATSEFLRGKIVHISNITLEKTKTKRWMNVYSSSTPTGVFVGYCYSTRAEADEKATDDRIACIEVSF